MEFLRSLHFYAESRDMHYILIGGMAINAHGVTRQTLDIDLLVKESQRSLWDELMDRIHYQARQRGNTFSRFVSPDIVGWPIDFMYVDDPTFAKLLSGSEMAKIGIAEVRIASARHMVMLKLHAMKQERPHRIDKDLQDTLRLLRSGKTGIDKQEPKELCDHYSNQNVFEKLKSAFES